MAGFEVFTEEGVRPGSAAKRSAARRLGFDVLHRLHRDLHDYERLVAALGIETPPQPRAKRLALSVETALVMTPSAPARAR